jgi:hypothetical protein
MNADSSGHLAPMFVSFGSGAIVNASQELGSGFEALLGFPFRVAAMMMQVREAQNTLSTHTSHIKCI